MAPPFPSQPSAPRSRPASEESKAIARLLRRLDVRETLLADPSPAAWADAAAVAGRTA